MKTPEFWYRKGDCIWSKLLYPASMVYNLVKNINKSKKIKQEAYRSKAIVICVGNIVAGGAGKTPVVALLLSKFDKLGFKTVCLSKGYGGYQQEPLLVDKSVLAEQVGDEPLLLSDYGRVIVAKNRKEGLKKAEELGFEIVILDDGLHDLSIEKDFNILVVNGKMGFGNGKLIPAGPMRETLSERLAKIDAVFLVGDEKNDVSSVIKETFVKLHKKCEIYNLREIIFDYQDWIDNDVIAVAGIANPDKFFDSLENVGVRPADKIALGDHRKITNAMFSELLFLSKNYNRSILVTEKDYVKLSIEQKKEVNVIRLKLVPDNLQLFDEFINSIVNHRQGI